MKNEFAKALLKNYKNKSNSNLTDVYIKKLLTKGTEILNVHQVDKSSFNTIQNEVKNVIKDVTFNLLPYDHKRFKQASNDFNDDPELQISKTMEFTKNPWDDNIIIDKNMNYFNKFLFERVEKYLNDNGIVPDMKPIIKNSWMTKSSKGKSLETHTHCKACISGTYYYKTTKDSGNICFYSPKESPDLFEGKVEISPKDGMIVMFPGILPHSVLENKSSEDRYGISFNIRIFKHDF
tara:strand:- start:196 stop:903 length:708 start_codon:yes stop_codon:yes gene_type:complete